MIICTFVHIDTYITLGCKVNKTTNMIYKCVTMCKVKIKKMGSLVVTHYVFFISFFFNERAPGRFEIVICLPY